MSDAEELRRTYGDQAGTGEVLLDLDEEDRELFRGFSPS